MEALFLIASSFFRAMHAACRCQRFPTYFKEKTGVILMCITKMRKREKELKDNQKLKYHLNLLENVYLDQFGLFTGG